MMDGNWSESATGKIDLEDDDPAMVAKMIDFLYTARYDDDRAVEEEELDDMVDRQTSSRLALSSTGTQMSVRSVVPQHWNRVRGPLITNAKLYILGDKYDIPFLKEVAARKYKEVVRTRWDSSTFAESVSLIWNAILEDDDVLQETMVGVARDHIDKFLGRDEFLNVLRENGYIAVDFLKAVVNKKLKPCNQCRSFKYALCNHCESSLEY